MSGECVIRLQFEAPEELEREFRDNLSQGRAFTPQLHPVEPRQPARLLLSTPCSQCEVQAEVVMVSDQGPVQGVGLALTGFDAALRARLEAFVAQAFAAPPAAANQQRPSRVPMDDAVAAEGDGPPPATETDAHSSRTSQRPTPNARMRTLRDMPLTEQVKLARKGQLADRVALERLLGKTVWDALLHNPRITVAEVARIARKGTVPRPLLELIVDNAAWAKTSVVRRALLSNPKLSADMIVRLLKFAPRNELKAMVRNPSYPNLVRSTAKRMIAG